MKRLIARIELSWDKNPFWAFVLIAAGAGAAIWTGLHPKSPGFAIGLLALTAGIMSTRSKMHLFEKLGWVVILMAFTYQEMKAIEQNDINNRAIRDSQNAAFGEIVGDLKTSITNSKDQYTQTVSHVDKVADHVDGVAKTMQQVAEVTHTNLLAITGGNSFAFVYPSAMSETGIQQLKIHNVGDQSLTDVRVTMSQIVHENGEQNCNAELSGHDVFAVGPLAPHEGRMIQNALFLPHFGSDGTARYQIWINAQNRGVSEQLEFRKASGSAYFEYKFAIGTPVLGKKTLPGDVKICGIWFRSLKKQDWTTTFMTSAIEDPANLK